MDKLTLQQRTIGIALIISFIISAVLFCLPVGFLQSIKGYPSGISDYDTVANRHNITQQYIQGSDVSNTLRSIYYTNQSIPVIVRYKNGDTLEFYNGTYYSDDTLTLINKMRQTGKWYIAPFDRWNAEYTRNSEGNIIQINYSFNKATKTTIADQIFDNFEDRHSWSFFTLSSETFRIIPLEVEKVLYFTFIYVIILGISLLISWKINKKYE